MTCEEVEAMANEVLDLLAEKGICIRDARWVLQKADFLLEETELKRPKE